jgi:hypothetical protein
MTRQEMQNALEPARGPLSQSPFAPCLGSQPHRDDHTRQTEEQ